MVRRKGWKIEREKKRERERKREREKEGGERDVWETLIDQGVVGTCNCLVDMLLSCL